MLHLIPRTVKKSTFYQYRNIARVYTSSKSHSSFVVDKKYKEGQQLHGYTIKNVNPVNELHLTTVLLEHDKTKAEHLHVIKEDGNNVFGVSFRTTPMDSSGVPHILEHTALCGSKKFPVRDPFFKMLNRSLSTFMNAFTASDWTMYPFSTQNIKDYENLMSVYLDAAFFPNLNESDFRQEGWRLEHQDVNDSNSPLVFKGIVYNEMKGHFSNSQNIFMDHVQRNLIPSHTYGVVSGGNPPDILKLSWQELRDFHKSHYHPSNSRFFTYGTFPLETHLKLINDNVLSHFSAINPNTEVPVEAQWDTPRESHVSCASDPLAADPDKQTTVAVSYMMPDITNLEESFTLSMISSLLVDGEKAPFYRSLLEPNIGSDYSPILGYDKSSRNGTFSVGLQGIHKDDVERVKKIIDDTFDEVIRDGFPQERIDALLHRIELSLKHQYSSFGINLLVSTMYYWNHSCDLSQLINTNAFIQRLKTAIKENPRHLQEYVEKHFKNNNHKLITTMSPDDHFEEQMQAEEQTCLSDMINNLTLNEKQSLYEKGIELQEIQSKEEDLSCLPTLKVSDISKEMTYYSHSLQDIDGCTVQVSQQPTNGVTYFRGLLNTQGLPDEMHPYLPLFANVLTKMGAGQSDYKDLSQKIDLYTGEMSASCHISGHHTDGLKYKQGLLLSSFCLDSNIKHMMQLWLDILNELNLTDMERLQTLVQMSALELSQSVSSSGHRYAMAHAASTLSGACKRTEQYSGVSQVKFMASVAESNDLSPVIGILKEIGHFLLNKSKLTCSLNVSPETLEHSLQHLRYFLINFNSDNLEQPISYNHDINFKSKFEQVHLEFPFQVNYIGKCFPTVAYSHEHYAGLRILARLVTNKYLHREIREKGGAYGGGAISNKDGAFQFFSYRDPNFLNTLKAFNNSVEWAIKGEFTKQDINEAKLAIFSQVDSPLSPGERGMRYFLSDISDDMLQQHREQLFAVQKNHLTQIAEQYLLSSNKSSVCLLGAQNSSTRDNPDWIVQSEY